MWPLRITAVLNVGAALGMLLFPVQFCWFAYGPAHDLDPLGYRYHQMLWAFVAVMGLAYGYASTDPRQHRGIVLAGGLGKLSAVVVWIWMVARGEAWPVLLSGVAFDGSLGVLFCTQFIRSARGAGPKAEGRRA